MDDNKLTNSSTDWQIALLTDKQLCGPTNNSLWSWRVYILSWMIVEFLVMSYKLFWILIWVHLQISIFSHATNLIVTIVIRSTLLFPRHQTWEGCICLMILCNNCNGLKNKKKIKSHLGLSLNGVTSLQQSAKKLREGCRLIKKSKIMRNG